MRIIGSPWDHADTCSHLLADLATSALIDEAELTPKPGLVDMNGSGAHTDLSIELMRRSALALRASFAEMALVSYRGQPCMELREELARIGRHAESLMMAATDGVNTHRGAIWAIGLLLAGASICGFQASAPSICAVAGEIARFPDRFASNQVSNGTKVQMQYGVEGARGEACQGFPHVMNLGLPMLEVSRSKGIAEPCARIDALLAVMSKLNDTCLLHRGGIAALKAAQHGAKQILELGGSSTHAGWERLQALDVELVTRHASPGGSADLLAATLLLDRVGQMSAAKNESRMGI